MKADFYKLIAKGNHKGGVLYAPEDWPYPIASDGKEVKNWQRLVLELKDGPYRPFSKCVGGANVVSREFKESIQSFIEDDYNIEFLPVKVISKEYGDNIYYIMHFKKIYDVIDKVNTVFVPNTISILKLVLDWTKVKNLKVFNSQPAIKDVIVSEDVYRAIIKEKLKYGTEFLPIYCARK